MSKYSNGVYPGMFRKEIKETSFNPKSNIRGPVLRQNGPFKSAKEVAEFEHKILEIYEAKELRMK